LAESPRYEGSNARPPSRFASTTAIDYTNRRNLAPFVAALVDVSGLVIYFSLAKVVLAGTLR
jgi:hypothetical protein